MNFLHILNVLLDCSVFVFSSYILTLYFLRNKNNLRRAYFLIGMQISTMLSQLFSCVGVIILSTSPGFTDFLGWNMNDLGSIFTGFAALYICLVNTNILSAFGMLSPKFVTPKRLTIWKIVIGVIFIATNILHVIVDLLYAANIPISDTIDSLSLYLLVLWSMFVVIYDNAQALFILRLVQTSHLLSQKGTPEDRQSLRKCMILIGVTCFLDWLGIAIFAYGTITNDPVAELFLLSVPNALVGIHSFIVHYLSIELKRIITGKSSSNAHSKFDSSSDVHDTENRVTTQARVR